MTQTLCMLEYSLMVLSPLCLGPLVVKRPEACVWKACAWCFYIDILQYFLQNFDLWTSYYYYYHSNSYCYFYLKTSVLPPSLIEPRVSFSVMCLFLMVQKMSIKRSLWMMIILKHTCVGGCRERRGFWKTVICITFVKAVENCFIFVYCLHVTPCRPGHCYKVGADHSVAFGVIVCRAVHHDSSPLLPLFPLFAGKLDSPTGKSRSAAHYVNVAKLKISQQKIIGRYIAECHIFRPTEAIQLGSIALTLCREK